MHLGYEVARGHWKNPHTNYLYGQYVNGDIDELIYFVKNAGFNAFADGPWFSPRLYERLSEEFPDAKFILCVRNTGHWFESLKDMILSQHEATVNDVGSIYKSRAYGFYRWFQKELGPNLYDEESIMNVYNEHNAMARGFFGPSQLLVMKTEELDWKPLCKFLGRPKPHVPFPRVNVRRVKL